MGTVGRNMTPTNVSDGFYYVPLLQTLEILLNNTSVFDQVYSYDKLVIHACMQTTITNLQVMSGAHQTQGDFMMDICDGDLFADHCVFRGNEKALQIIGYYDEVTLTNPIGSRAKKHKIGTHNIKLLLLLYSCRLAQIRCYLLFFGKY